MVLSCSHPKVFTVPSVSGKVGHGLSYFPCYLPPLFVPLMPSFSYKYFALCSSISTPVLYYPSEEVLSIPNIGTLGELQVHRPVSSNSLWHAFSIGQASRIVAGSPSCILLFQPLILARRLFFSFLHHWQDKTIFLRPLSPFLHAAI